MAKVRVRSKGVSSMALLLGTLGAFFIVLGITGIIPQAGEGIFQLSRDRTTLEIVFGVIELACGAFCLYDALRPVPRKTSTLVLLVILGLWLVRVVVSEFIQGIDLNSSGILFRPNFWSWALTLVTDLVIAVCVWIAYKAE